VEVAGTRLGVSRSVFFDDVSAGKYDFALVKVGAENRISWPAIERWLQDPNGFRTR
jgi:hypothetical protein